MALEVAETFEKSGIKTLVRHVRKTPLSDIISDLIDASYIAVGSPTLNNGLMPSMAAFLCYLKGLNPRDLNYLVFGSFGWGGQGVAFAVKELEEMKFKKIIDPIRIQYSPSSEQMSTMKKEIASSLKEIKKKQ